MKVIDAGHTYELESLEGGNPQILSFITKAQVEVNGELTFQTVRDGTTNEEVLKVLIDRLKTLNQRVPSRDNSIAITKLEESLMWLERRRLLREEQGVLGTPLPHKD